MHDWEDDGHPLKAFPAHQGRIKDATKAKEQQ